MKEKIREVGVFLTNAAMVMACAFVLGSCIHYGVKVWNALWASSEFPFMWKTWLCSAAGLFIAGVLCIMVGGSEDDDEDQTPKDDDEDQTPKIA